jgi:pimeloyl-ACP methyl ester carboxylesterase
VDDRQSQAAAFLAHTRRQAHEPATDPIKITLGHIDPAITAVTMPTLVAVGDRDRICLPEDVRGLADRVTGAHFHILRNCGHLRRWNALAK